MEMTDSMEREQKESMEQHTSTDEHPNSTPTEPKHMPPAWGWREIGAVVALTVAGALLLLLVQWGLSLVGGLESVATGATSPVNYATILIIYGVLLFGIYRFAGWEVSGWRSVTARDMYFTTPLMLVLMLSGMVLINIAMAALQGGAFENPQVDAISGGEPLSSVQLWFLLVLLAGVVPVAEELFFRGMLYPVMRSTWNPAIAIVGSAALFAVIHFIPLLLPTLFFMGVVLALLREWSGSTIPCIVLHGFQNGMALLAFNAALSSA
jgi:hypothetical protein